ncbi:MAG: 50S ribosomal protein L24 [Candidatus Glassbacteria bacterium]|nr:50S ribosomal protein L24 [Candidatus Glassbacteria bacterium]
MRIVKNDTVMVVSGNHRGKVGQVLKIFTDKQRVIVKGVNLVKRHTRPTQKDPQGGIVEKEAPIHLSNVMLYDEKSKKPTRVRFKTLTDEKGSKVRVSAASGEVIETKTGS